MPDQHPLSDSWDKIDREALRARITRALAHPAPISDQQFIPHYPKSVLGSIKIDCRGGCEPFRSMGMDSHELARFIEWANDHAHCMPKESR